MTFLRKIWWDALSSKAFEISMQVENLNKSASGDFNLALKLSNDEPALDESEYSSLSFTYDDTAKTAKVSSNASNLPSGELIIPGKVMHNGEEYTITSLSNYAFELCSLTSATLPSSVTKIGEYPFDICQSLESVNIPSAVTDIGRSAFYMCSSLKSINIPTGVTMINASTFGDCTSLTSIIIHSKIGYIGEYAFSNAGLPSATVEITTGWTVTPGSGAEGSSVATPSISTTDLAANAKLLTDTYRLYTWTRA